MRIFSVLLAATIIASCSLEESDFEKRRKQQDEKIKAYLEANNVSATRDPSGLYYLPVIEKPQAEPVSVNDVVSIYYNMQTLDGEHVGKTTDSLAPAIFRHDYQSLVPLGVDYGVQLMKKGEKFRFFIPSALAYGDYSHPDFFDPQSIFIVDIEVVSINSETQINKIELDSIQSYINRKELEGVQALSSGLHYQEIVPGTGSMPLNHGRVSFHYERRYLNDTIIEKTSAGKPVSVQMGSGLVPGLEEGLLKMKEGEKALLIMPSKLAFGESIQVLPMTIRPELIEDRVIVTKTLPYSPLIYEVELVEVAD